MGSPYTDVGDIPSMEAADVNSDGKTDLILTHSQTFVEVLISKGDGTFEPGVKVDERGCGYGLVVADFDGDCKPDILAPSFGTTSACHAVGLHINKGNGTFKPAQFFELCQDNATSIRGQDFNGDGWLDIIFQGNGLHSGPPSILMNTKGKFGGSATDTKITGRVAFGDLDGDGAIEYATVARDGLYGPPSMCVAPNKGNGQFGKAVCYPMKNDNTFEYVEIADLNSDGKKDVVVCGGGSDSAKSLFNIFINKGDGTFDAAANLEVESHGGKNFLLRDVDNDGKPDFVILKGYGNGGMVVFKNLGNGKFDTTAEDYGIGSSSSRADELLVSGDFEGNGLVGFAALDRNKHEVSVIAAECKP